MVMKDGSAVLDIVIQGGGSSLWGESGGSYRIPRAEVTSLADIGYPGSGHLQLFGEGTEWVQYTDEEIERQVEEKVLPEVNRLLGLNLTWAGWSEQGMQPEDGWDFDCGDGSD